MKELFIVLCSNFKPWYNRIVISLQYQNLHRKSNESAQEYMVRFRTKVAKCPYIEYDRLLTEQFISGLNDDDSITNEILKIVATLEGIKDVTSECILL